MIAVWHWAVHMMGADAGQTYGQWNWYSFHSGIGGNSWMAGIAAFIIIWFHHKCHTRHCWRWGRFPVAGGQYRVCAHHHPDLADDKRPTAEFIRKIHAEWKDRT